MTSSPKLLMSPRLSNRDNDIARRRCFTLALLSSPGEKEAGAKRHCVHAFTKYRYANVTSKIQRRPLHGGKRYHGHYVTNPTSCSCIAALFYGSMLQMQASILDYDLPHSLPFPLPNPVSPGLGYSQWSGSNTVNTLRKVAFSLAEVLVFMH
jgi:hypothetical protein